MLGLWVCVSVSPDCELLVSVQKRVMVSLSLCCFSGFQFMKSFFRSKISLKLTAAGEGGRARTESPQFVPRHGFLRKGNFDMGWGSWKGPRVGSLASEAYSSAGSGKARVGLGRVAPG